MEMERIGSIGLNEINNQLLAKPVAKPVEPANEARKMSDAKIDFVRRQLARNRLRRERTDAIVQGDPERVHAVNEQLEEITQEEIAVSIANLRFPQKLFEKWCTMDPPRAAEDPMVLIWSCPICEMEVMPAPVEHGFIRGHCLCEKRKTDQRLAREFEVNQEKKRRQDVLDTLNQTGVYSALGYEFKEYNLEKNTFRTVETHIMAHVAPKYLADVDDAFATIRDYLRKQSGNMLIFGPHGTGKTLMVTAMLNAWHELGNSAVYVTAPNYYAKVDSLGNDKEQLVQIEWRMKMCDILCIDEVDRAHLTDARFQSLYRVLNFRSQRELEKRGSAPTIMICNSTQIKEDAYDLQDHIGTPTASRMNIGLQIIFVPGEDQRKKLIGA